MNARIDVIDEGSRGGSTPETTSPSTAGRRRIDVTEMDARSVQQFVRRNVGTDQVSLEHRGARTYLVVEG